MGVINEYHGHVGPPIICTHGGGHIGDGEAGHRLLAGDRHRARLMAVMDMDHGEEGIPEAEELDKQRHREKS